MEDLEALELASMLRAVLIKMSKLASKVLEAYKLASNSVPDQHTAEVPVELRQDQEMRSGVSSGTLSANLATLTKHAVSAVSLAPRSEPSLIR